MNSVLSDINLVRHILSYVDYDTIINYGRTCRQAIDIYRDEIFWMRLAEVKMCYTPDEFREKNLSPLQTYILLLTLRGGLVRGSEKYIGELKFAVTALKAGDQELFDYILSAVPSCYCWNDWNWNKFAWSALYGGHKDLFDYVRTKAPSYTKWDWRALVHGATCNSNDQLLVTYVKSLAPLDSKWWKGIPPIYVELCYIIKY